MTSPEGMPVDEVTIVFRVMRFGDQISLTEDDVPVLADEGDVMAIFPHGNGVSSMVLLSPDQALRTAEALARSAKIGSDRLRKFEKENSNE